MQQMAASQKMLALLQAGKSACELISDNVGQ